MSAVHRPYPAHRLADRPVAAGALQADLDNSGLYLTDEVFLFRVIGLVDTAAGEMVELEDCFGLDVVRVPLRDPRLRNLRVVLP